MREFLTRAIREAEAKGKEPFDFGEFVRAYLHDRGSCERLSPDAPVSVRNFYLSSYYLRYPNIMSTREFASHLNTIDVYG